MASHGGGQRRPDGRGDDLGRGGPGDGFARQGKVDVRTDEGHRRGRAAGPVIAIPH